jgi:colanic acid biosynthesis glycosyl transferase WcaI
MRIVVHDYVGHPFQVQLSRALAARGHEVMHAHCPSYRSGKGALEPREGDPPTLTIVPVALRSEFEKHSLRRLVQEREYGHKLAARVVAFSPDVVISANTPLLSQWLLLRACRRRRIRFVFWQQDIVSFGMRRGAESRIPVVGRLLAWPFVALERRLVRGSDAVVVISEDFRRTLDSWRVDPRRVEVAHNWAPLEEITPAPRTNAWAREHGLDDTRVVLYSGTLGLKHNPGLLLELARHLRAEPDVRVVVVSEGSGADWLRAHADRDGLDNLRLLPFQPYERLSEVLATGDLLVVILEPDAGVFSVPSKVLSYLCASRPLLAAIPGSNLAARIVRDAGAGIVVEPDDQHAFVEEGENLLSNADRRASMAVAARAYAESAFDIGEIADRFETILRSGRGPEHRLP